LLIDLFDSKTSNGLLQHRLAPTVQQLSEQIIRRGNKGTQVCLGSTDLLQQ